MGYGDKCTRCGKCCKAIPCSIGFFFCGDHRPCKALELVKNQYQCGLLKKPSKYIEIGEHVEWKEDFLRKLFSNMLGPGMGCCTSPQQEAIDRAIRKRLLKHKPKY